ncbi:MAG: ROK family protein [Acidobacteria bacterium]|nr:ROK family protein [Acidobacteriota bacterium]
MSSLSNSETGSLGISVRSAGLTAVTLAEGKIVFRKEAVLGTESGIAERIAAFGRECLAEVGGEVERVGIAVPGLISNDRNRVEFSAAFPELSRTEIGAMLADAWGKPVTVENDANSGALGEYRFGAGRNAASMFYATLGTGIGGAIVLDGDIWRGSSGFAGEFGYVAINSDGLRLEDVASGPNIVRRAVSRIHQDATSDLASLDDSQLTVEKIVESAVKGDDFAMMMLERTGTYIGSALASVINLLNIERVVLGGLIMNAGDSVLDSIVSRARELSFGPSFRDLTIVSGELGTDAYAIGACIAGNGK